MFSIDVGVLNVSGPEAKKFLSVLISNDIENIEPQSSMPSLLLTPSGHTVSGFSVYCLAEEIYLLVCERQKVVELYKNLKRFLIRTNADIEDVSNDYMGLIFSIDEEPTGYDIESNYCGSNEYSFGISKEKIENKNNIKNQFLRISYGAISSYYDLDEKVIPQEANLERRNVSFTKGCYLGQELVCRIDSRGAQTPNKFFAVKSDTFLEPGESVISNGEAQGIVTSFVSNEEKKSLENPGPYNALIKISRKIYSDDNEEKLITISGNEYKLNDLHEVDGYFSY